MSKLCRQRFIPNAYFCGRFPQGSDGGSVVFATTPTQVAATAPSPTVPRKADLPGTGLPAALSNGGAAQAICDGERVSPDPSGAAAATAGSSGNVGNAANVGGPGPAVPAQSPAPAALPPPSLPPPYPSTMQVSFVWAA